MTGLNSYEIVIRIRVNAADPRDAAMRTFAELYEGYPDTYEVHDTKGGVTSVTLSIEDQEEALEQALHRALAGL